MTFQKLCFQRLRWKTRTSSSAGDTAPLVLNQWRVKRPTKHISVWGSGRRCRRGYGPRGKGGRWFATQRPGLFSVVVRAQSVLQVRSTTLHGTASPDCRSVGVVPGGSVWGEPTEPSDRENVARPSELVPRWRAPLRAVSETRGHRQHQMRHSPL